MEMRMPISFSRSQDRERQLRVLHRRRLGDLEIEQLRREARLREDRLDRRDQLAILELPRREIHRHAQPRVSRVVPRLHLRARRAQHPRADRHDELRLLGDAG